MPSQLHEALLQLFRNRPELAPELLRDALDQEVPPYTEARIYSAELNEVQPTEYRADLVILLFNREPVLGIVVEVQLSCDERKQYVWPVYERHSPIRSSPYYPPWLMARTLTPESRSASRAQRTTRVEVSTKTGPSYIVISSSTISARPPSGRFNPWPQSSMPP